MSLDTLDAPTKAEEVALWPAGSPEAGDGSPAQTFRSPTVGGGVTTMLRNVRTPTLTVFRPDPAKANGVGVIVCPGGGWRMLAWEHEGVDVARWLAGRGYAAFLLKYRLRPTPADPAEYEAQAAKIVASIAPPPSNATAPRSLAAVIRDAKVDAARDMAKADGQRALALVRERAGEWGVKGDRIGMIGFSAGGFLTCDVAMEPGGPPLAFAAPIYGGETSGAPIPPDAPPLFTAVAADDVLLFKVTEQMYLDWSNADRPAEIHVYRRGAHGFGMAKQGLPSDRWIDAFGDWLADLGFA